MRQHTNNYISMFVFFSCNSVQQRLHSYLLLMGLGGETMSSSQSEASSDKVC